MGIMIHSLVIGLTLSITTGPEFSASLSPRPSPSRCARMLTAAPCIYTASLVAAIVFHQLFEGLSLGIRIAGLPDKHHGGGGARALKPLLAVTFATTTPLGIGLGLATLGGARTRGRACLPLPPTLLPPSPSSYGEC